MSIDHFNAVLEIVGGALLWLHVMRARREGAISGVHWAPAMFFGTWGLWNLIYYPLLGQWWSAAASLMPVLANAAFLHLYWKFNWKAA